MLVPAPSSPVHRPRRLVALLLLLGATLPCAQGKAPEPPQRILLPPLGFQLPPSGVGVLLPQGAPSTVSFIDDRHLLVTFPVRRLLKRLPDCPPDDQDRSIDALVLDLSGATIVARTTWRVHDAGQYLWNLGHGRFLLRLRDTLTSFAPLVGLARSPDDAFLEQPFLKTTRRLELVLVSPEADLVTIETTERTPLLPGETPPPLSMTRKTQLNFYRVLPPETPADRMIVQTAGSGVSKGLLNLSLTSAGHLETLQESGTRWLFDFDPFEGKFLELSPFDSTCRPRPAFVSAVEFVAFGCRGSEDKPILGGFNLRGEQMWQQNFTDAHAFPNFAFAPAADRFALSRNIIASGSTSGMTVDFAPTTFTTQEIRVIETESGRQLLRVEAAPVQRQGQNYALSPDGQRLAVIRTDAIEVFHLPEPTAAERKSALAAQQLRPAATRALVTLASHIQPNLPASTVASTLARTNAAESTAGAESANPSMPANAASSPDLAPASPRPVAATEALGDPDPNNATAEPRKPPTLYTLPSDPPAKAAKPQ